MEPKFLEIVENGLGHPLIKYTFSRDKLNLDNIHYPTVLSNPAVEIEMLFANTRWEGILEILQKLGVGPETEPLRLPLVFEDNLLGILWIWGKGLQRTDLPIMSIFAKQIGVSLERARLFQEVQSLASDRSTHRFTKPSQPFRIGKSGIFACTSDGSSLLLYDAGC